MTALGGVENYYHVPRPEQPIVDPFTGAQPIYVPHPDLRAMGAEVLLEWPPPSLPGVDSSRQPRPARPAGHALGAAVYFSRTITQEDPAAVRLAYMPYPLDAANLQAFVYGLFPAGVGLESGWTPEIAVWNHLRYVRGERKSEWPLSEQTVTRPFVGSLVIQQGAPGLLETWRRIQALAVSVLWAWGQRRQTPPLFFSRAVAEAVAEFYEHTNALTIDLATAGAKEDAGLDLDGLHRRYERFPRRQGELLWRRQPQPRSTGMIAEFLYRVVGSAGSQLAECPHCGRVFFREHTRKRFCSDYCRKAQNKENREESVKDQDDR